MKVRLKNAHCSGVQAADIDCQSGPETLDMVYIARPDSLSSRITSRILELLCQWRLLRASSKEFLTSMKETLNSCATREYALSSVLFPFSYSSQWAERMILLKVLAGRNVEAEGGQVMRMSPRSNMTAV